MFFVQKHVFSSLESVSWSNYNISKSGFQSPLGICVTIMKTRIGLSPVGGTALRSSDLGNSDKSFIAEILSAQNWFGHLLVRILVSQFKSYLLGKIYDFRKTRVQKPQNFRLRRANVVIL